MGDYGYDGEAGQLNTQAIVIDNGTGMMKAGFAGSERPRYVFPSYVGVAKHKQAMFSKTQTAADEKVCGEKAKELRGVLKLQYPMKHGVITNLQDMTALWDHVYQLITHPPSEHPVLLTEAPLNPMKNRKQMVETFFEKFHVPAVFVAEQAILSLYASGRTTGVVLDSGHGVTHCVPVYEGFRLPHAVTRMDVAGADVTEYLNLILKKNGINFHTSAEMETVQNIKETMCRVAIPNKRSGPGVLPVADDDSSQTVYQLPDGNKIQLAKDTRTRAPEVLFDPSILGTEYRGVQYCVADAIRKSDLDLRRELYSSIVLAGGSTMFKGFGDRLVNELHKMTEAKVKIFAPIQRTISTWIGGSILSCLHNFKPMWITRKQFYDSGVEVLHRKGF